MAMVDAAPMTVKPADKRSVARVAAGCRSCSWTPNIPTTPAAIQLTNVVAEKTVIQSAAFIATIRS